MKTIIILIMTLILCGCMEIMSNEEIVKQINVCKAANLDYKIVSGDFGPVRVECVKPK